MLQRSIEIKQKIMSSLIFNFSAAHKAIINGHLGHYNSSSADVRFFVLANKFRKLVLSFLLTEDETEA